jgi:hypothetical protein
MNGSAIEVNDDGVRRLLADGKVEQVTWEDLLEASVLTTDEGPFAEDVYFVLAGRNGTGCVVPQSAPESRQLLERLQQLPGFDNETFIQAMASTEDATFVCWRRVVQGGGKGE